MIPLGTRVTVTAVHHNAEPPNRPERLIGRTGIVTEHFDGDEDHPNVVSGLGRFEWFTGVWTFADDELTPDTTASTCQDTPQEPTTGTVVMRFLTHGGATVQLHSQTFRKAFPRRDEDGEWTFDRRDAQGFNWRCTGCHTVGKDYSGAYDEHRPRDSREDANAHAGTCRAMPLDAPALPH